MNVLTPPKTDVSTGQRRLALFLVIFGAMAILLGSLPDGAVLSPDSLQYANTAHFLARGAGWLTLRYDSSVQPAVFAPPVYPLLLMPAYVLHADVAQWARFLNALFWGVTLGVFYRCLSRQAAPESQIPLLMTAIAGFGISMLRLQRHALTESFSLLGVLLTVAALAEFLQRGNRKILVLAAVTAAVVMLTRYAEWPLWGTGVLGLLFFYRASFRKRLSAALVYGLIAGVPTGVWLLYNRARTGVTTGYETEFSWRFLSRLPEIYDTFSIILTHHYLPRPLRWIVLTACVGVAVGLVTRGVRGIGWKRMFPPVVQAALLHAVLYIGFIVVTLAFSSLAGMNLGGRRFVGVWLLGLLAGGIWLENVQGVLAWTWRRRLVGLVGIWAVVSIVSGSAYAWRVRLRDDGLGAQGWREATAWEWLEQVPDDIPVFSNGIDVTYYHTKRLIHALPVRSRLEYGDARQGETTWADFEKGLRERNGRILFFPELQRNHYFFSEEQLKARYPLVVEYEDEKSVVYRWEKNRL